ERATARAVSVSGGTGGGSPLESVSGTWLPYSKGSVPSPVGRPATPLPEPILAGGCVTAHANGYESHEPHGYLAGDYPHSGGVTGDRVVRQRLVASAVRFFACGVHHLAWGSLTPRYVLCCRVGHWQQPEAAGRSSRGHETR